MSRVLPAGSDCGIATAIESVRVLPDLTGFEWFGRYRPAGMGSFKAADASSRRKVCADAVAHCLYENYYCVGQPRPALEQSPQDLRTGHSQFVQAILKANSTPMSWCEMSVVRVTESEVVSSLPGITIHHDRASGFIRSGGGKVLLTGNNRIFPPIIRVGGKSWSLSASPGFILLFGQREPHASVALHRVYWNLRPAGASAFVAAATHHLNRKLVGFRLKVLANPRLFERRLDTAVIYLDLRTEGAQGALAEVYCEVADHLRDGSPAMTRRIARGVAVAEDPGAGESFGGHRCRLIADACVRAAETEAAGQNDVLSFVEKTLADHGINMQQPYQLASSDTRYIRRLETAIGQLAHHNLRPTQPNQESSLEPEWLAVAEQIGRRLVAESFSYQHRCQWIGGEILPSKQLISRTLPVSLYSGTAGIGHFLSELATRTKSEEIAATALGALWHAISNATADEQLDGLYVGSLGMTVAAVRAGYRLGDQKLADQAAALAGRLAAAPIRAEDGPDLLYGLSGQILGFLTLADLLSNDLFKCRAVEIGQVLLHEAERRQTAWSWPNRLVPSAQNLTGMSHGAAGIAFALGQLWRCTNDQSLLTALNGAIVYEDSAFSDRYTNWPDYRTFDDELKVPQFPNFWCHGGAGIILSRVHLSGLNGSQEPFHSVPAATEALRQSLEWGLHLGGANFNLCHGLAGGAEILREASQWGDGSASWQQRAAATARTCWRSGAALHALSGAWPCGENDDNPSLFLGRAGIGYSYLRLHDPSVPSVLAFDPVQWSCIGQPGS
jgi:hypothetical protein